MIGRSQADTSHMNDWSADIYWWVAFHAIAAQTHDSPPPPLTDELHRVGPRLFLITAEQDSAEAKIAPVFRRAAGSRATFWPAQTTHTHALQSSPRTYEQRVVGFLDRALL